MSSITIAFDPAVIMARQSLYRFSALSLIDPKIGSWKLLDELRRSRVLVEAAALLRTLPEAIPTELDLGERPVTELDPQLVMNRLPTSAEAFNAAYESTFGLLVSAACPPYETEFINHKFAFQRSNALADISGFYRAFGVTPSDVLAERADHIVQELEFMAFLLDRERFAEQAGCQPQAEICREAQQKFLREHLVWWVPAFAKLLSREDSRGFYGALGVFLGALIPAERALAGIDAGHRPAEPSLMERPEACEGCQLG